jgi:replicative DNA helicase
VDANVAGVPLYGIRDGTLSEDEVKRYQAALKFQSLYSKQFHIIDIPRGCTMSQIESKYIEMSHELDPRLIVVDYISLMNTEQEGSDWFGLGKLSERLHEFCRVYQISGITPVQLNRPEKAKDGAPIPPDQHRVGRSIMMPQNANIMLIIETRKEEELKQDMKIIIGKMREGERGAFILHKRLDMMRIYDDLPDWNPDAYDGYGSKEEENDE